MELFELQAHKGGLIRLKSDLFWFGKGWDTTPERICILLDAVRKRSKEMHISAATLSGSDQDVWCIQLLIDGDPHWCWIAKRYLELV